MSSLRHSDSQRRVSQSTHRCGHVHAATLCDSIDWSDPGGNLAGDSDWAAGEARGGEVPDGRRGPKKAPAGIGVMPSADFAPEQRLECLPVCKDSPLHEAGGGCLL